MKMTLRHRVRSHLLTQNRHMPRLLRRINPSLPFSSSSISRLKKRIKFRNRSTPVLPSKKIKREGEKKEKDKEIEEKYLIAVKKAIEDFGSHSVYNYDETPLSSCPSFLSSFQVEGEDTIPIAADGNPQRVYSVGATISASGRRLPLLFIKKGVRENCPSFQLIKQTAAAYGNKAVLTEKGWITSESFVYYLEYVFYPSVHTPCVLIIDVYRAHLTEEVKEKARQLNINLIYVPASNTDKYQPLDVCIFGPVKSIVDRDFHPDDHPQQYVARFQSVFRDLSPHIVRRAFSKAIGISEDFLLTENQSEELMALEEIDAAVNHALAPYQMELEAQQAEKD